MKKMSKEKEYLAGWQRCKADFLNYKKEEKKRLEEFKKYANEDLILEILPILDGLDMGLKELKKALKIKEINIKKGERFNPEIHEAITGDGQEVDKVLQKGYALNDKVIRPSKVKLITRKGGAK